MLPLGVSTVTLPRFVFNIPVLILSIKMEYGGEGRIRENVCLRCNITCVFSLLPLRKPRAGGVCSSGRLLVTVGADGCEC